MKGGILMIKTALISVFDKENILGLATSLQNKIGRASCRERVS